MARDVIYEFDPFKVTGLKQPRGSNRKDILRDIGDYLVETVLDSVSKQQSPIKGKGRFQPLSPDYKKFKKAEGAGGKANLELEGDMLEALKFTIKDGKIRFGIRGKQGDKADNHNKFSSESKRTKVPPRNFIPKNNRDKFDQPIIDGMKDIIKAYKD
jgi:hypothetical protein